MLKKLIYRIRERCGITLIEILVVVIIITILAGLAIPMFTKTVENAKDGEAKTILKLIQTGEKIYRLKNLFYYPYSGTTTLISDINSNLNLDLDPERNWDYRIINQPSDFRAEAIRINPPSGYARTWWINQNNQEPRP